MTNLSIDLSVPDAEQEQATLADLLNTVERLRLIALGATDAEFQDIAMRIVCAAEDLEHMDGLVHLGQVYNATVRQMWGACRCADGKCAITPTDADFWRPTKRDAEDRVARMVERRGRWEKTGPVPHLVSQLVARTSVERVR